MEREVNFYLTGVCGFDVTIRENGCKGGDAGHGGYVDIIIKGEGGACMNQNDTETDEIVFGVQGDAERDLLIQALTQIVKELKRI
jgi:hypothetical protein